MKDIVVLILAGGDSSRFWPLSDKHSLPFFGKPFAYYHFSQLDKLGFKNVVVVVNEENKSLFTKLKNKFPNLNIAVVLQSEGKGMAGAILSAKKYITGQKILIRNGSDMYEDLLLSSIISQIKDDPDGIITGVTQDAYFPGGYLKISGGNVIGIVEKPPSNKTPSNIITIVFDYFKDADVLLSAISKVKSLADDVFEQSIDFLIKDGSQFNFLRYLGFWGYLKYPWHTLNIMSYFLHKIPGQKIRNAVIHKSAIITGDVFIEDDVKILENTKIVGPTYVGRGTIIGQNSLVRESMIGDNCVVGYSTEIARSYIGDNCWFHTNYVGDSVISNNVSMGAGAVLANFKLDEGAVKSVVGDQNIDTGKVKLGAAIGANVRIGVNSSVMPGVKIGKNSFIGSGVVLSKDLADDKYCCLADNSYIVKNNLANIATKSRQKLRKALRMA